MSKTTETDTQRPGLANFRVRGVRVNAPNNQSTQGQNFWSRATSSVIVRTGIRGAHHPLSITPKKDEVNDPEKGCCPSLLCRWKGSIIRNHGVWVGAEDIT